MNMHRYYITETCNGLILKTEWDVTEGGVESVTRVFEGGEGELLEAFDKMAKMIRGDFE